MRRVDDVSDGLLARLIEASDERSRTAAIEELVARATPLIEAIVSRYTNTFSSPDDLLDLKSTAMMRLVRRLDDVPRGEKVAIARFDDFVATLAFNVANDLLRERFPARTRLKNRIRYVLTHSPRVSSWKSPRGITAGFSEWCDSDPITLDETIELPLDDIEAALMALFESSGAALLLDDVVNAFAASWGVVELEVVPFEAAVAPPLDVRDNLAPLWREICELRANQRAALLLNLRDRDSSAIELFVIIGVATIDELAAALEITIEELAEIWNSLPLDDNTIAARLGVTRQQVINLRRAARDRLARRLGIGHNS
jgi:DNA-directed RNA polymerase specialized sigma24 family protein